MFIQRICGSLWQNVDHFGSGSIHGGRDHQSRKLKESCPHWVGNPIIVEDVDHILNIKSMRCESISMRHSFAINGHTILLQKLDAICRHKKDKAKHFRSAYDSSKQLINEIALDEDRDLLKIKQILLYKVYRY